MTAGAGRLLRIIAAVLALAVATLASARGEAQDVATATRDAGKHFQRGVSLYGEADYRAALIEFKRAYALAPNAAVLYNVGQTEYQLQDYAGALTTFERYLSESSPAESHRADVEASVQVLRARVGRLSITTVPPGADVSLDDQPVGKTPLEGPGLLVSIGRRRVTASMTGRPPVTRFVDVAADDNVSVVLQVPPAIDATSATASRTDLASHGQPTRASGGGSAVRTVGWIATGVLAASAVTFGLLAVRDSSDLKNARNTFPTTSGALTHESNLVSTYSALADSLVAAAIVVGAITLVSALSSSSNAPTRTGAIRAARVSLGPLASTSFEMTF
jgi:tetratricopeptide (TPR) repeat protein